MPEISDPSAHPSLPPACRVLGVGIATLDIINELDAYPVEDSESRVLIQRRVRGGNVSNTLTVLSQLGHDTRWLGTLADDLASEIILADFARHGVDVSAAVRIQGAATPTSYITLSRANGSRTIVHHRDLPELDASALDALADLGSPDWIHFEGRSPAETCRMMASARERCPGTRLSVELEKRRPGVEKLLEGPDVLLVGRAFAESAGGGSPERFLADLMGRTTAWLCVLGWGRAGAYFMVDGGRVGHVPAVPPTSVVDTLAAGDCLNAAVIDGLMRDLSPQEAVRRGAGLAGFKCGRIGLDGLVAAAVAADAL